MTCSVFALCLVWVKCWWRAFSWASSRYVGTLHDSVATWLACPFMVCFVIWHLFRRREGSRGWTWMMHWVTDQMKTDWSSTVRRSCNTFRLLQTNMCLNEPFHICYFLFFFFMVAVLFWITISSSSLLFYLPLTSCLWCSAAQRDESQFLVFCSMTIKTWILIRGLMCWFLLVCAAVLHFV